MSFLWARFKPLEGEIDEEVKSLYRNRDNDNKLRSQYKGFQVNRANLGVPHLDDPLRNHLDRQLPWISKPSDSVWEGMTEEERIENGLPTKFEVGEYSITKKIFYLTVMGK